MGRKKKKHIYLYDPETQKNIEELRKLFPDKTYDEIFKEHLNIPTTDLILYNKFFEFVELLQRKYKEPKNTALANQVWVLMINSAKGEFDIQRIIYDIEKSIDHKIYHKKKGEHHVHGKI